MKVEVSGPIDIKEGIGKNSGRPYRIASQDAHIHLEGEKYPVPTKINISEADHPKGYPQGVYEIDIDRSVSVGRYGIEFRDIVLGKQISPAGKA